MISEGKIIKTLKGTNWAFNLLDISVVELITDDDVELTIEDAKEMVSSAYIFSCGERKLNLFIVGINTIATVEALRYFSSEESKNVSLADAIVIHSLGQRLLANFLIKLVKGSWPMKVFSNKDDALKWLIQQK
ncbi:MAG: hypothetical protein IM600_06200 [Bacteroidetes bacterium]|nr:hypothetical protein [Bacteroidota bacterium]MCA6443006.1 hypothetical protein [Bacteroidota bacterium]